MILFSNFCLESMIENFEDFQEEREEANDYWHSIMKSKQNSNATE